VLLLQQSSSRRPCGSGCNWARSIDGSLLRKSPTKMGSIQISVSHVMICRHRCSGRIPCVAGNQVSVFVLQAIKSVCLCCNHVFVGQGANCSHTATAHCNTTLQHIQVSVFVLQSCVAAVSSSQCVCVAQCVCVKSVSLCCNPVLLQCLVTCVCCRRVFLHSVAEI